MNVNPLLTFPSEPKEEFYGEYKERQALLERVTEEVVKFGIDIFANIVSVIRLSKNLGDEQKHFNIFDALHIFGFSPFLADNIQMDFSTKPAIPRRVNRYDASSGRRVAIFCNSDTEDCLKIIYLLVCKFGFVFCVRITDGPFGVQATVEILTVSPPDTLTQEWVNETIKGMAVVGFKFNEHQLIPAGCWPQFGVEAGKDKEVMELMKTAHIKLD
jgi:hypothetical protein